MSGNLDERLRAALQTSVIALDDWLHEYAPEWCGEPYVTETRERIASRGGTLAYIAKVQQENRAALAALPAAPRPVVDEKAEKGQPTPAQLIEECGVLLAEAELECGHKHQKAFAKLSQLREAVRTEAARAQVSHDTGER